MDSPKLDADTVARGLADSARARAAADPDRYFLRWMIDHHAELGYLAHQALRHPDSLTIRDEAYRADRTLDAETTEMRALLRGAYGDTIPPAIRKEHVAMVTPFSELAGERYSSAFRAFLLTHHREAARMTDSLLPRLARPQVRALAQRLKAARARDIAALDRTLPGPR